MPRGNASAPENAEHEAVLAVLVVAAAEDRERIVNVLSRHHVETLAYATIAELIEASPPTASELVVLCIDADNTSPAKQIGHLRAQFGQATILLVCADIQRWQLRSVLNSGAGGVILQEEISTALGPCLRAVLAGQICVPRRHGRHIEPPVLSVREKQILGLVVMGHMNSEIAQRLYLAESTVKSHLSSAFAKLGVRSRNEAVELILDSERGLGVGILALVGEPLEPPLSPHGAGERQPTTAIADRH